MTLIRIAVLICVTSAGMFGQDALPECFVEFSAYDALGERLRPVLVAETFSIGRTAFDVGPSLLERDEHGIQAIVRGRRLYFPRALIGPSPLRVSVRHAASGRSSDKVIALTACRAHETISMGEVTWELGDLVGFTFNSRLHGCRVDGDWWVRAEPLFGWTDAYESTVEPTDGSFTIVSRFGVRHLIVVGRGRDIVKVFARNLDPTQPKVDPGYFDVGDSCPEENR